MLLANIFKHMYNIKNYKERDRINEGNKIVNISVQI